MWVPSVACMRIMPPEQSTRSCLEASPAASEHEKISVVVVHGMAGAWRVWAFMSLCLHRTHSTQGHRDPDVVGCRRTREP